MKVLRWGVCALAALLMTAGSSFANDSEIEAMKAAMDNMKQEMDAMRATMSAEREAMRESAGGAPEALRSKGGNATVRIGGSVVVRYDVQMSDADSDQDGTNGTYRGGEYTKQNGFTMDTASVTFDFQINEDLSAFIDVRPDKFDKAYFQWTNIGGTGLGAQIGYISIPGGMYSASWAPCGSVLITNPATKSPTALWGYSESTPDGVSAQDDITEMGLKVWYEMDQFKLTATIYNSHSVETTPAGMGGFSGLASEATGYNGQWRNGGIDHTIMAEFSPAFMEGLHFSFTYGGHVDGGEGTNGTNYRGTTYAPEFDLGVAYVGDKFSVWATGDFRLNPGFYSDTYEYGISLGANYNVTDRLSVGAAFDWTQLVSGNDTLKKAQGMYDITKNGNISNQLTGTTFTNTGYDYGIMGGRISVGAKYTFCNGVWVRGNYAFGLYGHNVAKRDQVRSSQRITLETGVSF